MFPPFQHMSNEVRFQVPSTPYQQRDLHIPSDRKQPRFKRLYNSNNNQQDHDEDNEKKKKKMEHRKIEKKRRQEMSNLSSSLRSLLPLHFIKGRQSMSEHINQAVTYINHLQENVKVLNTKRDELKKTCIHITDSSVVLKTNMKHASVSDCSRKLMTVIVGCSHGGITILIKSYYTKKEAFPISRVMKALLQEGLDIISCNSTQVNDRLIYSIESEVIDETTCIQVSLLQKKLTELVNTDSLIAPPFMDI